MFLIIGLQWLLMSFKTYCNPANIVFSLSLSYVRPGKRFDMQSLWLDKKGKTE